MILIHIIYHFVYANISYIGKDKKDKLKPQYCIIFTCIFLLKIFASSKQIFIDATFKVILKKFYQTLIIIAKDNLSNINIPCFYIPMSNKKLETYNKIFSTIFEILKTENIKYKPKDIQIMCDFELFFYFTIFFSINVISLIFYIYYLK